MTDPQLGPVHRFERGDLVVQGVGEILPGVLSPPGGEVIPTVIVVVDIHMGPDKPPRQVRFHFPADLADRLAQTLPDAAATSRENARKGQEGRI
jgi:hypothetical protein